MHLQSSRRDGNDIVDADIVNSENYALWFHSKEWKLKTQDFSRTIAKLQQEPWSTQERDQSKAIFEWGESQS